MRDAARLFGKVTIVVFCLWHMTAIAVYALPDVSKYPTAQRLRDRLGPTITPYLLMTSQWQQWNLFSPDPLRRVTSYRIEIPGDDVDGWVAVEDIEPGALPWWRHAAQFKMLGSLLDGNTENSTQHELAEHYLQLRCPILGLHPGNPIRLTYRYYVIPAEQKSMSVDDWWKYTPDEFSYTGHETVCIDPPTS